MDQWIDKVTDQEGRERIRLAVQNAESKTSCEIVPMIVRQSTPTGHTPLVLFLLFLVLGIALLPYVPKVGSTWAWEIAVLVFAWGLARILSHVDRFHVWLTHEEDLRACVDRRATHEFYIGNLTQTEGKNGILVFVSLLEKRAVILADSAVASQLPRETWNVAVQKLVEKTKAGDFAGGMCAAIEDLSAKLAPKFPLQAGHKNELSDNLVVKD